MPRAAGPGRDSRARCAGPPCAASLRLGRRQALDYDGLRSMAAARVGTDALEEVVTRERDHGHWRHGTYRRGPGPTTQQRDLPEVLACGFLAAQRSVDAHLHGPFFDDVEPLGLVILGDDVRSRGEVPGLRTQC